MEAQWVGYMSWRNTTLSNPLLASEGVGTLGHQSKWQLRRWQQIMASIKPMLLVNCMTPTLQHH